MSLPQSIIGNILRFGEAKWKANPKIAEDSGQEISGKKAKGFQAVSGKIKERQKRLKIHLKYTAGTMENQREKSKRINVQQKREVILGKCYSPILFVVGYRFNFSIDGVDL